MAPSNEVWLQACDTVNTDRPAKREEPVSDSTQAPVALQTAPAFSFSPTLVFFFFKMGDKKGLSLVISFFI